MTHDDRDEDLPPLIAHRGNAAEFPENTLEAVISAVELGLRHVEFDVQLTADLVPVVLHDSDLLRVAGRPECVHDLAASVLAEIPIVEASRFGSRYAAVRVPTLAQVAGALQQWPHVTGFVEIKRASLRRFGHDSVLERITAAVAPMAQQCIYISFDLASLRQVRQRTAARVGWVIERYDADTRAELVDAVPDFVFADVEQLPADGAELWPGPWQWAVYEVRDVATARRCGALGASYVETMQVRQMLEAYAVARRA